MYNTYTLLLQGKIMNCLRDFFTNAVNCLVCFLPDKMLAVYDEIPMPYDF